MILALQEQSASALLMKRDPQIDIESANVDANIDTDFSIKVNWGQFNTLVQSNGQVELKMSEKLEKS